MIGFIKGTVVSSGEQAIILTSSGVGYEIYNRESLNEGSEVELFITHILRENTSELYAHQSIEEKKFFEMLLTVKGVGPKSAFSLIRFLAIDDIFKAIVFENSAVLRKVPGIGPKAAAQIILDLKDKVSSFKLTKSTKLTKPTKLSSSSSSSSLLLDEAMLALKELGFKEEIIFPIVVRTIEKQQQQIEASDLVQTVLKEIKGTSSARN
ncbi:MAG: Holliday junction branch migration protein RuvA [Oligoflexia bacterium]|nr:Holliday junction branch migration protein RuvA [Oligoflexia bacterium]